MGAELGRARIRTQRRLVLQLTLTLGYLLLPGHAVAQPVAPPSFFGLQSWTPPSNSEFAAMSRARAGLLRFGLTWSHVEPSPGDRLWTTYDRLIARAARRGIVTLPVLSGSPSFVAPRETYPPRSAAGREAFASFVRDAVARYGRGGAFWAENPTLPYRPVKFWQVWNEPNFLSYWYDRPNVRQYLSLLKLARKSIHSVDSHAGILLAGVAETLHGIPSLTFLERLYSLPGAKRQFDGVALHPYAYDDEWVLAAVRRARALMNRHGDRQTKLWVTELGWATAGAVSFNTRAIRKSKRGQAVLLTRTYRALLRYRRRYGLATVVWFALRDRNLGPDEGDWWGIHTGLFDVDGEPKPGWSAYARVAGGRP
jgi:hypothetical protein